MGRRVGRWLLADEGKLGEAEQRFAGPLLAEVPGLGEAVAVAKRLRAVEFAARSGLAYAAVTSLQ